MSEEIYRVGWHQPQNLYRGEKYIGVMFDPADAAMVVAHLNASTAQVVHLTDEQGETIFASMPTERIDLHNTVPGAVWDEPEHPPFRDGEGDWWRWDSAAEGYRLDGTGAAVWRLLALKETYGTWGEEAGEGAGDEG